MKPYTIILKGKSKEMLFRETVNANSKVEAWDMVKSRIIKAIRDKGAGEIEIKEC